MTIRPFLLILVAALSLSPLVKAQVPQEIVKWSATISAQHPLKPGARVTALLSAEIENGWHVYALSQAPGGPVALKITVPAGQSFRLAGSTTGTKPQRKYDPNFEIETEFYTESVKLSVPLMGEVNAPSGTHKIRIDVLFQACSEKLCLLPATTHLEVTADVAALPKTNSSVPTRGKIVASGGASLADGPIQAPLSRSIKFQRSNKAQANSSEMPKPSSASRTAS